ncbi:GNAT family N-acetyltransferase [Undibacterium luofuense]|uniref:GNAT family N-acetyltransferase n=1 Tax=Undibacterium luofuense TaxID=2828733 RepID=A0A941I5K2_9BURK|nr:GNAT family N-acetyltransferase [Undibacterium luofuense]MBR7780610.1 GNAT family N-acetyltransferase [Undibacterium luofuense]
MSVKENIPDQRIRAMQSNDVSAVYSVQQACYVPQMVESADLILQRWQHVADTSWVAEDMSGVGAYLVAYRSQRNKISALGEAFVHTVPADVLYLHDMAVHPRWRGGGVAARLLDHAHQYARANRLTGLALVSVQDTLAFWQKLGFVPQIPDDSQQRLLSTYAGAAHYCIAPVQDTSD